ncbi:helix-turn-helix domain-containing protein [Actinokineospora auranticolor]|uniref:MarR family protein n=1 Tax=Actinokineospora auranticolor TaxID=155976 RepID=A0A2S6GD26_9PSEU|nr:helix-turn-helix domain-containing protein [Actinokineospora auranticolor]PPK62586.1 MarR family protein [Actinokineospora auranticolor]
MPGGRLTAADRRVIAEGLAAGLGYAEIARRLDRPTSTVSREVARNGGGADYRASDASAAAGERARRRPPGTDRVAVSPTDRGFAERLAAPLVEMGLPRMAARVLVGLVTSTAGGLTATELTARLGVSPASVSKAVAYLERIGLVTRERTARRERYLVGPDMWTRTWLASARSNAAWADAAHEGARLYGPGTPVGDRLAEMAHFLERLNKDMDGGPGSPTADMLTVVAAVMHAGGPITADDLASALGWPPDRATLALADASRFPMFTDPVALHRDPSGRYTAVARSDRLTGAQLSALKVRANSSAQA